MFKIVRRLDAIDARASLVAFESSLARLGGGPFGSISAISASLVTGSSNALLLSHSARSRGRGRSVSGGRSRSSRSLGRRSSIAVDVVSLRVTVEPRTANLRTNPRSSRSSVGAGFEGARTRASHMSKSASRSSRRSIGRSLSRGRWSGGSRGRGGLSGRRPGSRSRSRRSLSRSRSRGNDSSHVSNARSLSARVDGVVAGFVDASVKSIGVEELALLLSGIREVSTLENRSSGSGGQRSTRDSVIDTRVVVAEFVSATVPRPLKSPGTVS